ncbi:hypothetical protein PQ459_15835 [Chryseobacterium sp. KACC 21268]|nr:hypothetical protein PQ459_15835 [Chryseobacterium sp. KACC 21268]
MQITSRKLNSNENDKLSLSIKELEKANDLKINWLVIFSLLISTCLFAIHIYYYDKSNWSLLSKFLVCLCPIIMWIYIENRVKIKKQSNRDLNKMQEFKSKNSIDIIEINTSRIVEFLENDDESILYLIENINGESIYIWDEQYFISENNPFPCDKFEIYLDDIFIKLIGEKVFCKGERIESIEISGEDKWKYFQKGFPQDLEIEKRNLNEVIGEIEKFKEN